MDSSILKFGHVICFQSKIKNRMATSVDPDEAARYEPSNLYLHYLHRSLF